MLGFHLLLHAAPSFYLRHSTQLQVALRLAYYAFPLLRQPRGAWGRKATQHGTTSGLWQRADCKTLGVVIQLPTTVDHAAGPKGHVCPLLPAGIQSMLNREATPGPAGALLDILRVAWGAWHSPQAAVLWPAGWS